MNQAIILAAGEGQRLRPFTVTRPKVMLSIAGKPILQYVVEALAGNGIRDLVFVVGYRKDQVYDYFGSGEQFGVNITYVTQGSQLGTAHALLQAKDLAGKEFLVLPGDNLIESDTISDFIRMIQPQAVLVKRVANPAGYGVVYVENGQVKGIVEKPEDGGAGTVNTGIYAFNSEIFQFVESVLDIPDALNNMIAEGHNVAGLEAQGTWLDVAYPWDILNLNGAVLRGIESRVGGTIEAGVYTKGPVSIGKDTTIRSNCYISGPVLMGCGSDVGPNVCIKAATTIGDNVVISPFTEITNSVIGDDVSIGPGSIISNSVIARGSVIKAHFIATSGQSDVRINNECPQVNVGAMLGEDCNIGSNVNAQPGVIVGNGCQIQPMKVISGRLPDRSLVL
jgi:UDP-N-acetylglucosamine diphosphorylase / glucose-1-phosphate thymidylyltransferase / UDP-N-acetylgalactosamine diphosphorylase / glucosamine-1-phosphate N-acetyltransferase / galactosamine-1-phosphate N-acetyltransferase